MLGAAQIFALANTGSITTRRLDLEKITAPFLLVNSADDFINPPEPGLAEREMKRVKHGRFVMLPATETSHGHGMHSWAVGSPKPQ
jgi:hypothetical protein